jgi:hypothetical protein
MVAFVIQVENINESPEYSNPGPLTNSEGDSINKQITVVDPDTVSLQYSASGLPSNLAIDDTGIISGSIGYDQAGVHTITLTVTDSEFTDSVDFEWTITNTNRAPEIPTIDNKTSLKANLSLSQSMQLTGRRRCNHLFCKWFAWRSFNQLSNRGYFRAVGL